MSMESGHSQGSGMLGSILTTILGTYGVFASYCAKYAIVFPTPAIAGATAVIAAIGAAIGAIKALYELRASVKRDRREQLEHEARMRLMSPPEGD